MQENGVDHLTLIHQSFELRDRFLRIDTHFLDLKKIRNYTKVEMEAQPAKVSTFLSLFAGLQTQAWKPAQVREWRC